MIRLLLALACGTPALPPTVEGGPDGVAVRGEGVVEVTVLDDGLPIATQRAAAPVDALAVRLSLEGAYTVRVRDAGGVHEVPLEVEAAPPFEVVVEAPVGQGRRTVEAGEEVIVPLVEGSRAQVAVTATARRAGPLVLEVGDERVEGALLPTERLVALVDLSGPTEAVVTGEEVLRFRLVPDPSTREVAAERLRVVSRAFPADGSGAPDLARPGDRIDLPSPWWRAVSKRLGLAIRLADVNTPWAWEAVTLENTGDRDVSVALRARVLDADGVPEPAFEPRMRDKDDGTGLVSVLLKVPAGSRARAAVPLFLDPTRLPDDLPDRVWQRELAVAPLGSSEPLVVSTAPLAVGEGSSAASLGFVVALIAAALGSLLLALRGPGWLREARTSDLMTVALFGTMTFLVGAGGALIGMSVAAVLGPFSPLLTGLLDDVFRYAILATLVTLLPRPGIAALAVLVSWLVSGMALGTFTPTDLLFVGGRVFWLELALWLSGVTRVRDWPLERPFSRFLRLGLGFAFASVATSATGLVLNVVLYRLFLADWYVALILGGPAFLYVLLACAIAVPFAASLREVQR